MPTKTLKRIWCKTCNEFQLHAQSYPNWEDWFCNECETTYSSIKLKDIPDEKLVEQRKRYKAGESRHISGLMGDLLLSQEQRNLKEMVQMFSPPGEDTEIIESDAGQRYLDKLKKRREIRKEIK